MAEYSDEELNRYFNDPDYRRNQGRPSGEDDPSANASGGADMSKSAKKKQAAYVLGTLLLVAVLGTLIVGAYMFSLDDDMPSIKQLENPTVNLATVAYTMDGKMLARYAHQNRSWVPYDSISNHVINALVATEDHRFHQHWGIDMQGLFAAVFETVTTGDLRGASTITQQLARNLYNEKIGREVTIPRKLKEMVTAVELERRYTKREIIEMYLNTVSFGYNAFGIEAAAQTFFGKDASDLNVQQSATLIGMLKAVTYYNPVRNPENARSRRNVVLNQMRKRGYIDEETYAAYKDEPINAEYNSAEITASRAPYFAEHVRQWMEDWGERTGHNIYTEGLIVYTTLDSEMQSMAREAVDEQMTKLQAVVDYQWSRPSGSNLYSDEAADYLNTSGYEPFAYYWQSKTEEVKSFIRESAHFKELREQGLSEDEAFQNLRNNEAFIDSLKAQKTRLEAGLVSIDPRSGFVKSWVGGRSLKADWYDHVSIAKRQPGSTFKPFVYTAAIDNGYSPYYTLKDTAFTHYNPEAVEGQRRWSPENAGGFTNRMMTLREGLANSKNSITGQLILEIQPETAAFYARRMGVKSELNPVPSLALGTSPVTLLEMVSAYSTLANGGLYYEPTVVTRIEDRRGNVLYEDRPAPEEAISEETAYTVIDMMRDVIDQGTGRRINWQWGLNEYDLAGKTGTTQKSADGWFILMHPQLVTGAWVGFNDQRVAFRTNFWGQGAHNALFLVGDYFQSLVNSPEVNITNEQFQPPPGYGVERPETRRVSGEGEGNESEEDDGGIRW